MNNLFKKLLLASTVLCGVMSTNSIYSMDNNNINIGKSKKGMHQYNNISTNIYNILHNHDINLKMSAEDLKKVIKIYSANNKQVSKNYKSLLTDFNTLNDIASIINNGQELKLNDYVNYENIQKLYKQVLREHIAYYTQISNNNYFQNGNLQVSFEQIWKELFLFANKHQNQLESFLNGKRYKNLLQDLLPVLGIKSKNIIDYLENNKINTKHLREESNNRLNTINVIGNNNNPFLLGNNINNKNNNINNLNNIDNDEFQEMHFFKTNNLNKTSNKNSIFSKINSNDNNVPEIIQNAVWYYLSDDVFKQSIATNNITKKNIDNIVLSKICPYFCDICGTNNDNTGFDLYEKNLYSNIRKKVSKQCTTLENAVEFIGHIYDENNSVVTKYNCNNLYLAPQRKILQVFKDVWKIIIKYINDKAKYDPSFKQLYDAIKNNLIPKVKYLNGGQIDNINKNTNSINNNINNLNINQNIQFLSNQVENMNLNQQQHQNNMNSNQQTQNINNSLVSFPSLGLENIGATCYMNATLQCLAHISNVNQYIRKVYNQLSKNNKILTNVYLRTIGGMQNHNSKKGYYTPTEFKNIISEMNPLFKGIQANDSKDLIIFILETMHNELNVINHSIPQTMLQQNQYDEPTTRETFINYFARNYNSPISNKFYGMYDSMMGCCNCRVVSHNYQCYNIFIFPLEEVRKFKQNQNMNNIVSIYDCFDYYRKQDVMIGEDQIYCNNCNTNSNAIMQTKLYSLPEIMIINLNRGRGKEFNVQLNALEYLDLSKYVQEKNNNTQYELIGVICHLGNSSMSGHFIAYGKTEQGWYKYNDTQVTKVPNEDLSKMLTYDECDPTKCNSTMKYVLFYKTLNPKNNNSNNYIK